MHPSPGCLPCKSRKKKCNGVKPTCKGCQYNYLVCVWPSEQQKRPNKDGIPSSALSMFSVETRIPPQKPGRAGGEPNSTCKRRRVRRSTLALSVIPNMLSPVGPMRTESKFLLDHYLHRTGKMASAHIGRYTPFIDALVPIAHTSTVLLDSILAFSSFHLTSSGSSVSPVNTLEHQALALRGLKYGITRYSRGDQDFGIPLFLSMLMMCCVELANGGQGEGSFQHLTALRNLAPTVLSRTAMAPESYQPAVRFGRELYAYFLTLSCICSPESTVDPAIIHETTVVFSDINAHGYTGGLFGCSGGLFSLVSEAVALLKQARKLPDLASTWSSQGRAFQPGWSEAPLDELSSVRSKVAFLLTKVSLWEPLESSDGTFQMSGRIFQLALTTLLVEASHWCDVTARMVHTLRVAGTQATPNLEFRIAPLITEFIDVLEKLPSDSWIVTTMCWSMVVLGSYTSLPWHRHIVRDYLVNMEGHFGFGNMTRSRILLEHIWSKTSTCETYQPTTIPDAMVETGGRFMLG